MKQIEFEKTVEEKIDQTCQITLDAVLKTDANGTVVEPVQLDASKLKEALTKYRVGSILNVSSHTLTISEWKSIHQAINKYYQEKFIKIPILYGIDAI